MTFTLRARIFLTLLPLLVLIAVQGIAGVVLLAGLGNSISAILRENYDSVKAMERLREASERIDSSFQFALTGQQFGLTDRVKDAYRQYQENWKHYRHHLDVEQHNITLPGEGELVQELTVLTDRYAGQGDEFYERLSTEKNLDAAYFGKGGLLETFLKIQDVSARILRLNQVNMEEASEEAQHTARASQFGLAASMLLSGVIAGLLVRRMTRTVLRPIQSMTEAARGIAAGNLDQLVPYTSQDELGQLAQSFNQMTHRLRDFRRSQVARLFRAQQTSQATIDSFPEPVIVVDAQGHLEMANPAARRVLGVQPPESGRIRLDWQPPEPLRQPLDEALRGRGDYLPESFDFTINLGPGGQERTYLPRILTIRDPEGDLLGAAVVLTDVTRFRLLDDVKSNLVATVSHELKTPLTSIRLAVHLLLEESVGPLNAKQTELLLDARENSERLLDMVNNLLDLGRLELGRRQLEIVPERPEELLETAAEQFLPRARDKGVELAVETAPDLPEVAADAARLGLALHNLVDNALTYTDRGGRVTLSAAAGEGDHVILSVADTGRGIPAHFLPHVFEKFFRVPGQSPPGGTGLGLAIVQEIVVAHGGLISCTSQVGQGTVFRITLPSARSQSSVISDQSSVVSDG
jgi:signal transduction histidine kinase